MILFKLVFGIGAGESGILPMLVALVLLELASGGAIGPRTNPADSRRGVYRRLSSCSAPRHRA